MAAQSGLEKGNMMTGVLGGLVGMIMKPLMQPLLQMFDKVVGDPGAVRDTSAKWREMSEMLRAVADFEAQITNQVSAEWAGDSQQAFHTAISQLLDAVDEIAGQMDDTSEFLNQAADGIEQAEQLVQGIIQQLVEWAMTQLAAMLAMSGLSFGATLAAGKAAAAAQTAVGSSRIVQVLTQITQVLQQLSELLKLLKTAKGIWDQVVTSMGDEKRPEPVHAVVGSGPQYRQNLTSIVGDDYAHVRVQRPYPAATASSATGSSVSSAR